MVRLFARRRQSQRSVPSASRRTERSRPRTTDRIVRSPMDEDASDSRGSSYRSDESRSYASTEESSSRADSNDSDYDNDYSSGYDEEYDDDDTDFEVTTVTSYSSEGDAHYWTDDEEESATSSTSGGLSHRGDTTRTGNFWFKWRQRGQPSRRRGDNNRTRPTASPRVRLLQTPRSSNGLSPSPRRRSRTTRRRFRFPLPRTPKSDSSSECSSSIDEADLLRLELEDLGYDLNCDSFISKGSSKELVEPPERYGLSANEDDVQDHVLNAIGDCGKSKPEHIVGDGGQLRRETASEGLAIATNATPAGANRKKQPISTTSSSSRASKRSQVKVIKDLLMLSKSLSKSVKSPKTKLAAVAETEREAHSDEGASLVESHEEEGQDDGRRLSISLSEATWEQKVIHTRVSESNCGMSIEILEEESTSDGEDDERRGLAIKVAPSEMTNTSSKLRGSRRRKEDDRRVTQLGATNKRDVDKIVLSNSPSSSSANSSDIIEVEKDGQVVEDSLESLKKAVDNPVASPRSRPIVRSPMQRDIQATKALASEKDFRDHESQQKGRRKFFATPLNIEESAPGVTVNDMPAKTITMSSQKLLDDKRLLSPTESFATQPKSIALSPNGIPEDDAEMLQTMSPRSPSAERLPPPPPKIFTSPMDVELSRPVIIEGMSVVMGTRDAESEKKPRKERHGAIPEMKLLSTPKKTKAQIKEEKALLRPWMEPSPLSEPDPNPRRLKATSRKENASIPRLPSVPESRMLRKDPQAETQTTIRQEAEESPEMKEQELAPPTTERRVRWLVPWRKNARKDRRMPFIASDKRLDYVNHSLPEESMNAVADSRNDDAMDDSFVTGPHQQTRDSEHNREDSAMNIVDLVGDDERSGSQRNSVGKTRETQSEINMERDTVKGATLHTTSDAAANVDDTNERAETVPITPRRRIDNAIQTLLKQKKEASKRRSFSHKKYGEMNLSALTSDGIDEEIGEAHNGRAMAFTKEREETENGHEDILSDLASPLSPNSKLRKQNLDGVRALVGTWFSDVPGKGIGMDSPAFFETVATPNNLNNGGEDVAAGQIEVTFDEQLCLVNSDLRPVAKLDDASSIRVRKRSWSPVKRSSHPVKFTITPRNDTPRQVPTTKTPINRIDPVECFKGEGETAMRFRTVQPQNRIEVSGLPPKSSKGFKVRNLFSQLRRRRNNAVHVTIEDGSMPTTRSGNSKTMMSTNKIHRSHDELSAAEKAMVVQSILTPRQPKSTKEIMERRDVEEDVLSKLQQQDTTMSTGADHAPLPVATADAHPKDSRSIKGKRSMVSKESSRKNQLFLSEKEKDQFKATHKMIQPEPLNFTDHRTIDSHASQSKAATTGNRHRIPISTAEKSEKKGTNRIEVKDQSRPAQKGNWQDFMNLDLLGALNWTKNEPKLDRPVLRHEAPATQNTLDVGDDTGPMPFTEIRHPTNKAQIPVVESFDSLDDILKNTKGCVLEPSENVPPTSRSPSKPAKTRSFFSLHRGTKKDQDNDDKLSIGLSSKEPSSFFAVEYNDDNDMLHQHTKGRPTLGNPGMRGPPSPLHSARGILRNGIGMHGSQRCTNTQAGTKSISDLLRQRSEARQQRSQKEMTTVPSLQNGSTLTSFPGMPRRLNSSRIPSAISEDTLDTWAEIADASFVVERAMDRLDTLKSEDDIDDPARLKALLASVSDDQSIGDIDKALATLRKHATRLGVKEADLLLAVESTDTMSIGDQTNRSYKDQTLAQEIFNVLSMYMKGEAQ